MKIDIEEIAVSWHVTKIAIIDEHFVVHVDTPFASPTEAERDARAQAERYLREHLEIDNSEIVWDVSRVSSLDK